ncbi:MAG TPA: tetratricopeptide repeat protein [Bryobacteraceae bacterium]
MGGLLILLLAAALGCPAQSSEPEQALLVIQAAIQAGDLQRAVRLIDEGLVKHPEEAGLLNLRGIVHARREELPEARKDFSEAVRLKPGLTPAWQNLARACQLEGDRSCAIDAWQHVLRLKPGDREALVAKTVLRSVDLAARGQVSEATREASRLAAQADFSEADFESLQSILAAPKAAAVVVTLVQGLDARHAASLGSLRQLAVAYERLQRPAEARKTLERVALLDPNNTAHLLELARLADAGKDYEGALGYLAHARVLAPDNAQIHFLFAMVAEEMNLPIETRASLGRALALDPGNPAYNYAMGTVILDTRDAAAAADYFRKFVKAKPADPRGHYALGIAYFASGDYPKAKEELRMVESNPKTAAGGEYFLGRMALLDGDADEAARYLRKSIERRPTFSESHTELARVLMSEGNLNEAHTELERALRLDPTSFQGNQQLLVLYGRTNDPRAEKQEEFLKKLDQERSRRSELMLRTIEVRP